MLSPHVTRAPTPLSRLSALGVTDTRHELERLIAPGQGWHPTEVDNRGHDPGRWPAALVRPAALVQAWLGEANARQALQTTWQAQVDRLHQDPISQQWQALSPSGEVLAAAPVAVVASAWGSHALLSHSVVGLDTQALPLRPVQGQMSLAACEGEPLAERPQRDNGVFVPVYEDSGLPPQWPRRIWAMGSTYERGATHTDVRDTAHERNAQSLEALVPAAAQRLRDDMAHDRLLGWAQVRCASLDRLPMAGAVPDGQAWQRHREQTPKARRPALGDFPRVAGLYMLTALGSRGLTLANWCAQRVAEQIAGEAATGEADLLAAIDPARFAWRAAKRQP
jgi:tRNA 5-methylaminomethyl-2-thiouridine biosynthesis bifunctional protein